MNARTPEPPTHPLLAKRVALSGDPEIHEMFAGLIGDEAEPTVAQFAPTAVERAEEYLHKCVLVWDGLYRASFSEDPAAHVRADGMNLTEARNAMQDAQQNLADVVEIEAIGDLGGTWCLKPSYMCLYLCRNEDDESGVLDIPRGLSNHVIRTIIRAYTRGCVDGGNEVRDGIANILARR